MEVKKKSLRIRTKKCTHHYSIHVNKIRLTSGNKACVDLYYLHQSWTFPDRWTHLKGIIIIVLLCNLICSILISQVFKETFTFRDMYIRSLYILNQFTKNCKLSNFYAFLNNKFITSANLT